MSPRARGAILRTAIALAVLAGGAWWLYGRGDGEPAGGPGPAAKGGAAPRGPAERVVPVQTALAARTDLPIWLEGLGTVAAFQQVTVRALVDGRLDRVMFTEGQAVKKGEVLAQIDPRPFRVQLLQAQGALARDRATLAAARRNLERFRSLQAQQLVAQQQVDDLIGQVGGLEGAVTMGQAQVENAQLLLDYAQVKAPIDGVTGVRLVDAGNVVRANDPGGLVVITQLDPAAVFVTVPQDRLAAIAAAMARGEVAVEVWNRDGTQQLAAGKLAVLDNQINQASATLRLKALVPNSARALWPNAFVKARMLVETREDALVVPAVAIQRGPHGSYVYVVGADKTAVMKPVTVALVTGDQAVIEAGLDGGEQVVVEGQNQLRPGGRVEPVAPRAPASGAKRPGGGPPAPGPPTSSTGSAAGPAGSKPPAPS